MPRRPREKSATDVYHIMIRGINKQPIFCDEQDYKQGHLFVKYPECLELTGEQFKECDSGTVPLSQKS